MNTFTIYHNPKCSKSREALAILQNHPINTVIIEYLKTSLDMQLIKKLRSYFDLKDFVRVKEPIFKSLKLNLDNEEAVLQAILKEPILMQRPIITYRDKAIIARTPEKILALIATKLP